MWANLGFRASPYNTDPLFVRPEHVELLVGRNEEAIELYTKLDSAAKGTLALSGPPGVGKTSFLNVQQYLLESGEAQFGPKLLAARTICSVRPDDKALDLAFRALDSLFRSVDAYCVHMNRRVPEETKKLGEWLNNRGGTGLALGLTIAGFGGNIARQIQLPSVRDATFESVADAIRIIVSEVVTELELDGAIIAFDNVENLALDSLGDILISFRDTLFSSEHTWWVLIGQRGLEGIVQGLDRRVSQRMVGGIDMRPISFDELNAAIDLRANLFCSAREARPPPIPRSIHEVLFNASRGGMRFVFSYSEKICVRFVEIHRKAAIEQLEGEGDGATREAIEELLTENIGNALTEDQINHVMAIDILTTIVTRQFEMLTLEANDLVLIESVGTRPESRQIELAQILSCSPIELDGPLQKLLSQSLLNSHRDPDEPNGNVYSLGDTAKLAFDLGVL